MRLADGGRLLAFTLLTAAAAQPAFAAKLTDLEHTRIDFPRPADVPSDAEMEAAGAVIGKVDIDIRNIFDQSDARESNSVYRLADRLHIRTKPATIRAQLLFASGEKYQARKLAETERALRMLTFIYDARVVPVHYAGGKVDVKVITKDVWTLSPGFSFGRSGGANSTKINLEEENLLGYGKTLQVARGSTVDRSTDAVTFSDPNVFGSRWTSALLYSDNSDGSERSALIQQPFYSLDAPWSAKAAALSFDRTVSRYNLGEIIDQFNDNQDFYELSGGVSNGLIDGWTRRLTFGMRYDRNVFLPTPGTATPTPPSLMPPDRTLSYPFAGFDMLQDKYKKAGDENEIGRTEDLYFGSEISGEIGLSNSVFGANHDAVMLAAKALRGLELPAAQQLFLSSDFSSRLEQGHARNLIADAAAKYYWRWHENWLLYAGLSGTTTYMLDPDMQLLLGGDNGMRGYPLRFESGTSRALLTVEQRFFTDWYPFRLARVGGAVFTDVGRTWGSGVVGNSDPGLLKDVGFGLRLGNTRSGLGNVLHIDLAFPLNDIAGIQRVQLLVQTMQSF